MFEQQHFEQHTSEWPEEDEIMYHPLYRSLEEESHDEGLHNSTGHEAHHHPVSRIKMKINELHAY